MGRRGGVTKKRNHCLVCLVGRRLKGRGAKVGGVLFTISNFPFSHAACSGLEENWVHGVFGFTFSCNIFFTSFV
jgi:hypothetical protein